MKIRSVHPEFFTDTKVAGLSPWGRLLYVGLWCYADDYGRGRWLPKSIEGQVFPHDIVDIQQLLWELEKRQLVRLYEVDGERFFEIPSWGEWQNPRYQAKTTIPEPGEYVSSDGLPSSTSLFTGSQTFAENSEKTAQGEGEGEGEGEGAAASSSFQVFHRNRATKEVARRAAAGLPIKNQGGLARVIEDDPEFLAESERIWSHQDCSECGGSGFVETYSPGAGGVRVACEEPV